MVTVSGGVANLESETKERELLVKVNEVNIREASGLDVGKCPVGNALRMYDPASKWIVMHDVVCRYSPNGNFVYELPAEAIKFLSDWDDWYVLNALGSKEEFTVKEIEFIMGPHKYPEEYLVPSMSLPKVAF